jgi:aspartate/glutamate racemase
MTLHKKRLGIIGGAGSFASALFYENLVQESFHTGCALPEIILIDHRFPRYEELVCFENKPKRMQQELTECLHLLEACKVDAGILICNTLHIYLLSMPLSFLLFSLPELVLQEIKKNGIQQRLLLLGTSDTCNSSLYFSEDQILIRPNPAQQQQIEMVIDRILQGKILCTDAEILAQIIKSFPRQIDGVILACTELPVLHHHFPITQQIRVYDSVKTPARAVLERLEKAYITATL